MLGKFLDAVSLKDVLLPPERFSPFPRADDRKGWEEVPAETRRAWIGLAESVADYGWPALRPQEYREYWTSGDTMRHTNNGFERRSVLGILAMAECMEGEGRFLDQIVNGIYAVCEETTWVPPLHRLHSKENPDECMPDAEDHRMELVTATTADLLAWIHYLLREPLERISPRIRRRIEKEVRARLFVPYMERNDDWWMGFREGTRVNNWNPWCNSCALMAFLLLEMDAADRAAGVGKAMLSLDAFIGTHPADGCCDEGPTYWAASGGGLLASLELLALASDGKIDVFGEPLIRDIGTYIVKAHIHGDYYAAFADGDARAGLGGSLMYRFGSRIGDEPLRRLGASRPPEPAPALHTWFSFYGHLGSVFSESERKALGSRAPYLRDAWFPATQVMAAREREGTELGLYLAAKGGHNLESHNHNDVGSFIVFADGFPLFIDLGTETYKAQTFGPDRFELWYLQSRYHNLPTIRGVMQKDGRAFQARDVRYRMEEGLAELSLDLAEAYPREAGIARWTRTVALSRSDGDAAFVEVSDDFELSESADDVYYSLMTPCEPVPAGPGTVRLEYAPGSSALMSFDSDCLILRVETIELADPRLRSNWGGRIYRIVLAEKEAVLVGQRTMAVRLDRETL